MNQSFKLDCLANWQASSETSAIAVLWNWLYQAVEGYTSVQTFQRKYFPFLLAQEYLTMQLWNICLLWERSVLTCRLLYNLQLLPFSLTSLTEILKPRFPTRNCQELSGFDWEANQRENQIADISSTKQPASDLRSAVLCLFQMHWGGEFGGGKEDSISQTWGSFSQVQVVLPCTFVNILRIMSVRGHSEFKLLNILPGFWGWVCISRSLQITSWVVSEAERSGLYSCQEWGEDLHCSALPTLKDKQLFSVRLCYLKTVTLTQ